MSRHRSRSPEMTQAERDRFLAAATELHKACCGPLIAPTGDQARVLRDLNLHIVEAIKAVTGREPPWMWAAPVGRMGPPSVE